MSLKTNSKKACENIRKYILEDADYIREYAAYYGKTLETDADVIAYAYSIFEREEAGSIEQNYHNPCFVIFEDWARGLALGGLFCYYYFCGLSRVLTRTLFEEVI